MKLGIALCLCVSVAASVAEARTLYEGARRISGDRSPVIDLSGKTVMPALIATHAHPWCQRGTTYVRENYTADTIVNDLNRALHFGVSVAQSQGIETGDVMYQARRPRR